MQLHHNSFPDDPVVFSNLALPCLHLSVPAFDRSSHVLALIHLLLSDQITIWTKHSANVAQPWKLYLCRHRDLSWQPHFLTNYTWWPAFCCRAAPCCLCWSMWELLYLLLFSCAFFHYHDSWWSGYVVCVAWCVGASHWAKPCLLLPLCFILLANSIGW